MSRIDRRRLLRNAVLGSTAGVVGATAMGSLGPEAAFSATRQDVTPGTPDPNFAEGRISTIDGHLLHVMGSDTALHRIQVTDGTSIWKLRPVGFDQVKKGDGLYARGVKLPSGELAAEAIWVNIVNLRGHIRNITKEKLRLEHNGRPIIGHVVDGVSTAVYSDRPATGDLSKLRVGQHIQILGAWRPDTNEVDISTVYSPH